jgi:putative oxidoreductase
LGARQKSALSETVHARRRTENESADAGVIASLRDRKASPLSSFIESARLRVERAVKQLDWFAPLLGRVTVGVLFISTGWGKVHNLAKVAAFFAELHIPAPAIQATFVSYVELIGGALLLVGLFARWASLPLIGSMAVAILTAKADEVHGLPDLFGLVEWTYLVLFVWIALAGPGRASLDHLLFTRRRASKASVRDAMLGAKSV